MLSPRPLMHYGSGRTRRLTCSPLFVKTTISRSSSPKTVADYGRKKINSVLTFYMYRPKEELHFMGIAESGATAFSKPREFMADIHRDNLREAGVEFANDSGLREIQVGDFVATQYHARERIPKGIVGRFPPGLSPTETTAIS